MVQKLISGIHYFNAEGEFFYENNEEYFIETYISGKSDVSTAYLGKCGAERAEAIAMRFAKGALRPVHLEDALCDIAF